MDFSKNGCVYSLMLTLVGSWRVGSTVGVGARNLADFSFNFDRSRSE